MYHAFYLERQTNPEDRFTRTRVETDFAPASGRNNPPDDVEAEPGSLAHFLGGKEGIEDAGLYLIRDPWTVVGNFNNKSTLLAIRPDSDRALFAHRGDGVVDQIRPHLVELAAPDLDVRQIAIVLADDFDSPLQLVSQDRDRVLDRRTAR